MFDVHYIVRLYVYIYIIIYIYTYICTIRCTYITLSFLLLDFHVRCLISPFWPNIRIEARGRVLRNGIDEVRSPDGSHGSGDIARTMAVLGDILGENNYWFVWSHELYSNIGHIWQIMATLNKLRRSEGVYSDVFSLQLTNVQLSDVLNNHQWGGSQGAMGLYMFIYIYIYVSIYIICISIYIHIYRYIYIHTYTHIIMPHGKHWEPVGAIQFKPSLS